jgi:hypothetical protein
MKKLSLDLDRLSVESFATGTEESARGTVRGNDTRITEFCHSRSCPGTACCALEDGQPQANKADEPFE